MPSCSSSMAMICCSMIQPSGANEHVGFLFGADTGAGPVPGDHQGVVVQGVEAIADGADDLLEVAAPQVGAANAATKQGVPRHQGLAVVEPETDGPGGMPRGVQGDTTAAAEILVVLKEMVGPGQPDGRQAKTPALLLDALPQEQIPLVEMDRRAGGSLDLPRGKDVVEVGVGVDDGDHPKTQGVEFIENKVGIAARIHQKRLAGEGVTDDRAVALQGADRKGADDDTLCGGLIHGSPGW